jgi:O-antigen ligase
VYAVDSGYFAAMADTGLIGLAVLLMLFWRIGWLARRATRRPGDAGWLALGWMTTLLIDAVTRESFTGFPTAFLGLLLVGVALAAAGEQRQQAEPAPVAARRIRRVPRVHPAAT